LPFFEGEQVITRSFDYESLSLRGDRLFSLGFIIPAIAGAAYNHCVTHILTHVILHITGLALIIPEAFAGSADNLYLHMLLHIGFDTSPGLVHIIPAVAGLLTITFLHLLYLYLITDYLSGCLKHTISKSYCC